MNQNSNTDLRPTTTDVGAQRVAQVYAEALLNAADKNRETESLLEEFQSLVQDVFPADQDVENFLSSSAIGREHKVHVIQAVFEGRASTLFFNFLMVLNEHERLSLLRPILAAARQLHDRRLGRFRVQVRTAVPLPDDQRQLLIRELKGTFHVEPLLQTQVDPDLLGGIIVRVGDWLYDASVRTLIETIRNQLIERSSYEIQTRRDRFSSPTGDH